MKLIALNTIGSGKNKVLPGSSFEVPDMETVNMLISLKAAKYADEGNEQPAIVQSVTSNVTENIADLMQVTGVTESIAIILIENGIDSVDILQTCEVDKLAKIKGITKSAAKQIIQSAIDDFE